MRPLTHTMAVSMLTLSYFAGLACAQASYTENFESVNGSPLGNEPQVLIDQGWIFRNQAEPPVGASWSPGDEFGSQSFDGSGYLISSGLATDFFGGAISSWAILPEISGQQAGDVFTVWVDGGGAFSYPTYFDVRYAPSGTDTGILPDHVGDFTELLYSAELPIAQSGYQRVSVEVPGDGRIAMRFHAPYIQTFAGNGATISIDTVSVGPEGDDPCGIPIPNPGETLVWTAADGPYMVCQDITIPAGGRVEVEPGTTIDFSGGTLTVEGELSALGTELSEIVLVGRKGFSDGITVVSSGQVEIAHAQIGTKLNALRVDAGLMISNARVNSAGSIAAVEAFVSVDSCVFDGGPMSSVIGMVKVTNSSFENGAYASLGGLIHIDNVSIDAGLLNYQGESTAHPILLDNLSVSNNIGGPGIRLYGPNFMLGDNVTLENNLYPIEMDFSGAGLMHGSRIDADANTNNYIPVERLGLAQQREWANTGVPYVIGDFPQIYGGSLDVQPGTNLKFLPDAGAFLVQSANLKLQGTREEPILLESFNPNQRWFGLKWVDDFDAKMRHTIFDGGQISVQSDGGVMDMIHSTVRNSLEGTASVTGGIVRLFGSNIIDNNVGMVTTTSGRIEADGFVTPSNFEGNGVAVEYNNTNGLPFMRNNWWGDPTGPHSVLHPNGQGEEVLDLHPAAFTPFLTAPPLLDDEYPTVEMEPVYFTMQSGDKTILRWSSSDDDEVIEHLVQFADHDFPSEFQTIAVLGGDEFSYEFTAPMVAPNNLYPTPSAIRIVAVDSTGQESWDKSTLRIPYQEDWTVVEQDIDPIGPVVRPHENVDVCWGPTGFADAYVLMDGIGMSDSAGGTTAGCLPIGATLPYSSTDTARIVVITTFGAGGRLHYSFGEYFSIRPDERMGDEPPAVSVSSPDAGDKYYSNGVIPIRWSASDDEGLRSFRIQASYDGGRTWHSVIRDLPGETRAFDWELPESSGIGDVRVRVVAFDHRFQDSSSTTGAFSIAMSNPCPADFTGDGVLDFFDVSAFLNAYNAMDPGADLTGDGMYDFFDVSAFLNAYGAGCP